MKLVSKFIIVVLFVIFFGLALKNTQEVALYFFWDKEMRGPLVLILLCFFAIGSVLGVFAMIPMVFRNKRELTKHKKIIADMEEVNKAKQAAPSADSITQT